MLASMYFGGSNAIDVHNHHRKGILALQKKWLYAKLLVSPCHTLVGTCTVDELLMFKMLKPRVDEEKYENSNLRCHMCKAAS